MTPRESNNCSPLVGLRRRFLVLTDGLLTEKGYFEALRRLTPDCIQIVSRDSKDINKLVDKAIDMKQKGDYDKVAIVCDIDDRMKSARRRLALENAIKKAKSNGILLCLSHESFEVWLLAHTGKVKSGASSRKEAQRMALEAGILTGKNGKEIVPNKINKDSVLAAIAEAERLRKVYGSDVLKDAPTTNVDLLVKQIQLR